MARRGDSRGLSLTAKVNAIILVSLTAGVGAVVFAFALALVSSRDSLTKAALGQQAAILATSVENFMLPGEAPVAVRFFAEVASVSPDTAVALYRRTGQRAFSDGTTIARVNSNIGRERFLPRPGPEAPAEPPPRFAESASKPPKELFFRESEGGRSYYRSLRPLVNYPKCTGCHGADHTLRGVIDIRVDVSPVARAQERTVAASGGGFLAVVALLALVLGAYLRRVVLAPLVSIGRLCLDVTKGRFEGRVEVRSKDEIGELARTVNEMARGLYERFELTKYVSSGTIDALAAGQEPSRVARTLLFTDVRGFTSYTERRGPEEVVAVLNRLLEVQARLIHEAGGDIDKFVGDEVVAVFEGEDSAERACAAALSIKAAVEADGAPFDGLRLGAGIATGSVIRGMIGSERRADFTVIGDSVNVASRLCSMAKPGQVVACATTKRLAAGAFAFAGPYGAKLKGKEETQRVYLLSGAKGGSDA